MPRVGRVGAASVTDIGSAPNARAGLFDFSTPAGWTMFFWILSILVIAFIFFSL